MQLANESNQSQPFWPVGLKLVSLKPQNSWPTSTCRKRFQLNRHIWETTSLRSHHGSDMALWQVRGNGVLGTGSALVSGALRQHQRCCGSLPDLIRSIFEMLRFWIEGCDWIQWMNWLMDRFRSMSWTCFDVKWIQLLLDDTYLLMVQKHQ